MHLYEMSSILRERRKEDSIKLNYGSLYSVVESLQKRGAQVMVDWLVELLSTPKKEFTQFEAALSLASALPPDQVVELLGQRLRNLRFHQRATEAMFAEAASVKMPRLFMIEAEFTAALQTAEIAFVEELLGELRAETLGGFAMWRRMHELRGEGVPPDEIEAKISVEFADDLAFAHHYEQGP
jgi:hypothetical protein